MPELPEVETVRRGLLSLLQPPCRIARVTCRQQQLRRPVPTVACSKLAGSAITAIERRAKYLLFHCDDRVLINHLGMTGSWRLLETGERPGTHDHLLIHLEDGRVLAYRDPRRFGLIEITSQADWPAHSLLRDLGPEALDPAWDDQALFLATRKRRQAIKALLLDQRIVVGLGNIYVAEACHRAGIDPRRAAGSISRPRCRRLVMAIKTVLTEAIAAGGSTISDFRQAGGSSGYFQHAFRVYGRAGEPCLHCGSRLRGAVIAGRATVWCGRCQR